MNNRILKNEIRSLLKVWVYFLVVLSLVITFPGCKKNEDTVGGNWQGTMTIDMAHHYEGYYEWQEIIEHENEPDEVIPHVEYITWAFTNRVVIRFQFNLDTPLYNAQIDGTGNATQDAHFTPPNQCRLTNLSAPDFEVSVFGAVSSTSFNFRIVPRANPVLNIGRRCDENIYITYPMYDSALLNILSGIYLNMPSQNGATFGGSDTVSVGSNSLVTYIYDVVLQKN